MKTMKMTKTLFTVGCFLPALALANDVRGNGLSYDYVGIGYAQVRQTTTLRGSLMGVTIEGSKLVHENFFVQGAYLDTSAEKWTFRGNEFNTDWDYKHTQISVGYRQALKTDTDLIATVGVVNGKSRIEQVTNTSDRIFPVTVGVKSRLTETLQGSAEGLVVEGDFGYLLNLQYKISDIYALGGYLRHDKNSDLYALTVRLLF
jgi:hypothetical protein